MLFDFIFTPIESSPNPSVKPFTPTATKICGADMLICLLLFKTETEIWSLVFSNISKFDFKKNFMPFFQTAS